MRNWQGVVTGQGYIHGETKNTVVLRYSAGRSDKFNMTAGDEKPLFYDLYMRPGAIYWLQRVYPPGRDGESDIMAWDINYFSFDFNLISKSNVYATLTGENKIETPKSDACFIRCVEPVSYTHLMKILLHVRMACHYASFTTTIWNMPMHLLRRWIV